MKHQAMFWNPGKNKSVHCVLCPHRCVIAEGRRGLCGVRHNENGTLMSLIYASCSSVSADAVEKKPLYHFHPGSRVLSFGSVGCTFRCDHCQNYSIAMARPDEGSLQQIPPDAAVRMAKEKACRGVAWTYNEPTIWHEYTFECMKLAKSAGLYTVYVTNGYIQKEPLQQLSPYLDAMNVDVKAFHDEFYKKVCKATLQPVLQACEQAKDLGIHLELTYLVIPGLNDDADEIGRFCRWVADTLGVQTPVHFSRFHPDYKMSHITATPLNTLLAAYTMAKEADLHYVYLGNMPHGDYDNTFCPSCGNLLIKRHGFSSELRGLGEGKCSRCHTTIPVRID